MMVLLAILAIAVLYKSSTAKDGGTAMLLFIVGAGACALAAKLGFDAFMDKHAIPDH